MIKKTLLLILSGVILFSADVFAGKVELTTYYPAPEGEYKNLTASHKLTVPVKPVDGDTNVVNPGEIWVEGACAAGTHWEATPTSGECVLNV